jgi:hypothetical protein
VSKQNAALLSPSQASPHFHTEAMPNFCKDSTLSLPSDSLNTANTRTGLAISTGARQAYAV